MYKIRIYGEIRNWVFSIENGTERVLLGSCQNNFGIEVVQAVTEQLVMF